MKILNHFMEFISLILCAFMVHIFICGDNQPGGGFQAGALLGYLCCLNHIARGKPLLPLRKFIVVGAFGVMLYIMSGSLSLLLVDRDFFQLGLVHDMLSEMTSTSAAVSDHKSIWDNYLSWHRGMMACEIGSALAVSALMGGCCIMFDQDYKKRAGISTPVSTPIVETLIIEKCK